LVEGPPEQQEGLSQEGSRGFNKSATSWDSSAIQRPDERREADELQKGRGIGQTGMPETMSLAGRPKKSPENEYSGTSTVGTEIEKEVGTTGNDNQQKLADNRGDVQSSGPPQKGLGDGSCRFAKTRGFTEQRALRAKWRFFLGPNQSTKTIFHCYRAGNSKGQSAQKINLRHHLEQKHSARGKKKR